MRGALTLLLALVAGVEVQAAAKPYDIWSVDSYWDGGTVTFTVADSVGTPIVGCFAHTLGFEEDSGKLYLGAPHMEREGARLATAEEDSVVLALLIHALGMAYPEVQWEDKNTICNSRVYESLTDSKSRLLFRALSAHAGCGLPEARAQVKQDLK